MNSKQCMIKQAIVSELSGTYGRPNPELPKLDIFDKESCENMTNYIPRFKAGKEDQAHIQKIIDEWCDNTSVDMCGIVRFRNGFAEILVESRKMVRMFMNM